MLANFLSNSKPINFIVFLSLFVLMFILVSYNSVFAYEFSLGTLLKISGFFFLFLINFFFFEFILSKNSLTRDNFYAFFTYTLLLSFLLSYMLNFKILILSILTLIFLRKIYSLKSLKQVLQKLFDAGFWLGIACIIEPVLALYWVVIYTGIYLHKKITIHTLFTPIIGFSVPLIIYFTYCFWFEKTAEFYSLFFVNYTNTLVFYEENTVVWFLWALLLITIVAMVLKFPKAIAVNNSFKKNWILLLFNLVIASIIIFVAPQKNGSEIIYVLFPAAIIIANGFEAIKNTFAKNILFSLFLAATFIKQFFL